MRKVLVIASRDYQAAVRTKAFIVSLVVMPVLMLGGIVVQTVLKDVQDTADQRVVVLDGTGGTVAKALEEAAAKRNAKEVTDPRTGKQVKPKFLVESKPVADWSPDQLSNERFELSERVRKGNLLGFVEISPDVLKPAQNRPGPAGSTRSPDSAVTYFSNRPTYLAFQHWVAGVINEEVQARRFAESGINLDRVKSMLRPVEVDAKGLVSRDAKTGRISEAGKQDRAMAVAVPAVLVMLMFMMVIIGASPLLQSVVEEKTLRIAEVLLGSVTPFQLMLGKLLGVVGVSLTLSAVYLGGAYWAAARFGVADRVSTGLLAFFVVFQVLAVLMYGSLFIAVGAACTDLRETQSLLMPVMLLLVFPMFFLGYVLQNPSSNLSVALSFFPPATPMLMMVRQSIPPGIAVWQSALGVVVLLATTLTFVWAAGRIFRVGILLQGKGARVGEMLRWVVHG